MYGALVTRFNDLLISNLQNYCEIILVMKYNIYQVKREARMSEFAFFRFMSLNLLTSEEKEHKNDIIDVTEQVLDAEGIECDSKIAKLPEQMIIKILSEVRKRWRKTKQSENVEEEEEVEVEGQKESPVSAR